MKKYLSVLVVLMLGLLCLPSTSLAVAPGPGYVLATKDAASLNINYDKVERTQRLHSTFVVRVKVVDGANATGICVPVNNNYSAAFIADYAQDIGRQSTVYGETKISAKGTPLSTCFKDGDYSVYGYKIPAGQTLILNVDSDASITIDKMFAGRYYAQLRGLNYYRGSLAQSTELYGFKTNLVTLVGETSPYILNINSSTDNPTVAPGDTMVIKGLRLRGVNKAMLGSTYTLPFVSDPTNEGNSWYLKVKVPTNVPPAVYPLVLTSSNYGPSNNFYFTVGRSVPTCTSSDCLSLVTIESPNGGESLRIDQSQTVRFNYAMIPTNETLVTTIVAVNQSTGVGYVINRTQGPYALSRGVISTNVNFGANQSVTPGSYKIKVYLARANGQDLVSDYSDSPFTVIPSPTLPPTAPTISNLSITPRVGSALISGDGATIRWNSSYLPSGALVDLSLFQNGQFVWKVTRTSAAAGSYIVPRDTVTKPDPISLTGFTLKAQLLNSAGQELGSSAIIPLPFSPRPTVSVPTFTFVSREGVVTSTGVGNSYLNQSITFKVTAANEDVYLLKGASKTGQTDGVNGDVYSNGVSAVNVSSSQSLSSYDGVERNSTYLIPAGSSRTFKWSNTVSPSTVAGYYKSAITSFHWNTADSVSGANTYNTNMAAFQTDPLYVGNGTALRATRDQLASVLASLRSLIKQLR